jgi:hypothetical protein
MSEQGSPVTPSFAPTFTNTGFEITWESSAQKSLNKFELDWHCDSLRDRWMLLNNFARSPRRGTDLMASFSFMVARFFSLSGLAQRKANLLIHPQLRHKYVSKNRKTVHFLIKF